MSVRLLAIICAIVLSLSLTACSVANSIYYDSQQLIRASGLISHRQTETVVGYCLEIPVSTWPVAIRWR